jgi:nucleotide-binding universal stress UspA family protein
MFERIMVPVDTSAFAEQALPHAVVLARATGARLHLALVHEVRPLGERIVTLGSELVEAQLREAEEEYLKSLAAQLGRELGTDPEHTLLSGSAAAALARFAGRRRIDLMVMSTHGRGGVSRAWLGSVADAVTRSARAPTLLVRPAANGETATAVSFEHVLVAVDGSAPAEAAVRHAATLCAATGAACSIVRVVIPPVRVIASRIADTAELVHERTAAETREAETYLRELIARSDELPAATRAEVVTGYRAAEAILRAADVERADIIAVGTRGHGGAARLILGSVADKVIRGSHVPVLVCPQPRAD